MSSSQSQYTPSPIRTPSPSDSQGLSFNIRFAGIVEADGSENTKPPDDVLDLWVGAKERVRDVKRRIRLLRPALQHYNLRLIHHGRILSDAIHLVTWTSSLLSHHNTKLGSSSTIVNAVNATTDNVSTWLGIPPNEDRDPSSGKGKKKGKGKESVQQAEETIWLHCSIGEKMSPSEINAALAEGVVGEDTERATEELERRERDGQQIPPMLGFDRLREAGFSEEDIDSMRRDFRRARGQEIDGAAEDDEETARALEEQWLDSFSSNQDLNQETSQGAYTSILWGSTLGFFIPFLPILFFRHGIFSTRLQNGIVLGVIINILFAIVRLIVD
ncbi:hypothetical protein BT69DRAFT_1320591 [Atractiella rhizophila]|nr:hypothetical protein BT69DRAFT_1320591 [Atractiella rhizophila]